MELARSVRSASWHGKKKQRNCKNNNQQTEVRRDKTLSSSTIEFSNRCFNVRGMPLLYIYRIECLAVQLLRVCALVALFHSLASHSYFMAASYRLRYGQFKLRFGNLCVAPLNFKQYGQENCKMQHTRKEKCVQKIEFSNNFQC